MNDVATSSSCVVETDALGAIGLHALRLEISESLDEPYVARARLRIDDRDADILELLGRDMVLTMAREQTDRRLCGVVRSVQEGPPGADHVVAEIELVPALFLLSLRRNTRMFQDQTVPDIVEAVLAEALGNYGREVRVDLSSTYPTREYCMQYQESDLAFVQRLLAEEGISYSFDHQGDRELLVLHDSNEAFSALPGAERLPFRTDNLDLIDEQSIEEFARRHDHTSTSVVIRDFDWTAAAPLVEDEERAEDARGRDRESFEHGLAQGVTFSGYDAGGRRYQERDVAVQKVTRLEAHRRGEREALGSSRTVGLLPGARFELFGHPTVGLDGEYYVTRVVHEIEAQAGRGFRNHFECRPVDVPHRPSRPRRKPAISSIQSAVVTGPAGEEIHTDEHGRIKVRFHWDRENPADETSSCWIRCEQAWAGPGWGFWWVPRIGMEVVVHFVDGDPDRPVVTGCVYNAENRPPYALPDEKTKSTIRSNSSPGGGGYNELRFEDRAGSEEIFVHAQKDYNEVVLNDHTTTVHHDQRNTVDNDQTQIIGSDQTETVHGDQQMSVGGDRTVHVKGNFDETVDGTETRHTAGDVTETFDANETRDVSASITETISGNEERSVGGSQTETVGGSHTFDVGAASDRSIAGPHTADVTGGITEDAPAGYNITATGGFNVTVSGATTWTAPAGVKLIAPGGVTWVDSFDKWMGAQQKNFGMVSQGDFGLKIERGGLAKGICGPKIEQAAFEFIKVGKKDVKSAARVKTKGLQFSRGTFGKWLAGLIGRGC